MQAGYDGLLRSPSVLWHPTTRVGGAHSVWPEARPQCQSWRMFAIAADLVGARVVGGIGVEGVVCTQN